MAYNAVGQERVHTPSTDPDWRSSPSLHELYRNSTQQQSPAEMDFELPLRPSMTRVSSSASTPLRHPTPDLQSIQGAYISNIERLEQSAERLSMGGSDIGEELKKIRMEQKRSESRRSSLMNARSVDDVGLSTNRQFSYNQGCSTSNSIAGTNSVARSGGFSPKGYFVSPRGSAYSGSWSRRNSTKARSTSNSSRLVQMVDSTSQVTSPSNIVTGFSPTLPSREPLDRESQIAISNEPTTHNIENSYEATTSPQATPEHELNDLPRPSSADTYRKAQAAGLFADFAGVHTATHEAPTEPEAAQDEVRPRQSSNRISSAGRPQSFLDPVPGEDMIYYPAPVPMMLNLPQKLSKQPRNPQIDKRRSAMLSALDPNARKSAAWLPPVVDAEDEAIADQTEPALKNNNRRRTVGELPPQLRASLFFDYPSVQQDVEIKDGSAVKTLDSILDASAFAPVSAFTDHPIAGRVGKEVYGRAHEDKRASYIPLDEPETRKRISSINLLKKRTSSSNLLEDTQKRHSSLMSFGFGRRKSSAPQLEDEAEDPEHLAGPLPSEVTPLRNDDKTPDPGEDGEGEFYDAQSQMDEEQADEESELIGAYNGAPTTLLAELQLRKEQQKLRNRTAAIAFPNGMHSTLLELDAVAQIQKQARTKKHTHLAWEDSDAQNPSAENGDDEDVPLGVLFPSQKPNLNGHRGGYDDDDRPLGLIARREMEDNEPLSHRRARLRGEPSIRHKPSLDRNNTMYTLDLPGLQNGSSQQVAAPDDEEEGETLAQRLKRLKATKIPSNNRAVSDDFASEIMSQFGGFNNQGKSSDANPAPEPEEEEETLARRRARLQAGANKSRNVSGEGNDPALSARNKRRSMADLLQAHPAAGAGSRVSSNEKAPLPSNAAPKTPWTMQVQQRALFGELPALNGSNGAHPGVQTNGHRVRSNGHVGVPNPLMFNGNGPVLNGLNQDGVGEVRNRDMIDRWRQSVMY